MAIDLIMGAEDFANDGLIAGEIFGGDDAAVVLHIGNEHAGGFTAVKIGGAVCGDALQRGGEFRLAENVADFVTFAVVLGIAEKDALADGELLQAGLFFF